MARQSGQSLGSLVQGLGFLFPSPCVTQMVLGQQPDVAAIACGLAGSFLMALGTHASLLR